MVLHKYQLCKFFTIALHQSTIFKEAGSVGWFFKKVLSENYIRSYLNFSVTILSTTQSTVTIQNLVTIFAS